MCVNINLTKSSVEFEERYNAQLLQPQLFYEQKRVFGYNHTKIPVITNQNTKAIQMYQWGLIPNYAIDIKEQYKNIAGLNTRFETAAASPMWRNYIENRCLILTTGFFEHQHLDSKGKLKQLHYITNQDAWEEPFVTIAGIYNVYTDRATGEQIPTVSMYTLPANPFMSKIHNSGLRMPFILPSWHERDWLAGSELVPPMDDIMLESVKLDGWPL